MKNETNMWISLSEKHKPYYQLIYRGDNFDVKKSLISWIEEMYNEIEIDKNENEFLIWVNLSDPEPRNEHGNINYSGAIWTMYKIDVKWNPEFSIVERTMEEIKEYWNERGMTLHIPNGKI